MQVDDNLCIYLNNSQSNFHNHYSSEHSVSFNRNLSGVFFPAASCRKTRANDVCIYVCMHLFIYVSSFASVGRTVCTTYHNVHIHSKKKKPLTREETSGKEAEEMTVDSSDAKVK